MTKQDFLFKWAIYGIALVFIFVLQTMLLNRFTVFGVCPQLIPLAVVSVAVYEGSTGGAGFGVAAGLLCDAAFYNTDGFYTIVFMLSGLLSGLVAEYALNPGFFSCLICSLCTLSGMALIRSCYYFVIENASVSALLAIAGPEVLYSMLFVIPVYFIIYRVFKRVGGMQLA